jgi:UDP-glucose:glycoprotein glucosyltransferase
MILSMHQDNVPVRFGIIMYSSRLINVIEENDGSKSEEDTSTLVILFSVLHHCDFLGAL